MSSEYFRSVTHRENRTKQGASVKYRLDGAVTLAVIGCNNCIFPNCVWSEIISTISDQSEEREKKLVPAIIPKVALKLEGGDVFWVAVS